MNWCCKYLVLSVVLTAVFLVGCAEQTPAQVISARPSVTKILPSTIITSPKQQVAQQNWVWPVRGHVLSKFSAVNPSAKGIDIAAQEGTPVVAAADGEVVYSGNALRGYGNLIIIKHKKNFLTAYAHNRKNMVKEGDKVLIGQRIAEMGQTGTDRVMLHFEVRHQGKPIDPQGVLPLK